MEADSSQQSTCLAAGKLLPAETMVTFSYTCFHDTSSVELVGSWDNFTTAYWLKKDSRRGQDIWSGCFWFEDIICDGLLDSFSKPRQGYLRQGGRYWFFYRLSDGTELHDPNQPASVDCPLLPGQNLNLLEVPIDVEERSQMVPHRRSDSAASVFTMNPALRLRYKDARWSQRQDSGHPLPQESHLISQESHLISQESHPLSQESHSLPPQEILPVPVQDGQSLKKTLSTHPKTTKVWRATWPLGWKGSSLHNLSACILKSAA